MQQAHCSILSIAPYRILPPTSGGHLGIVLVHHYLGKLCQDHVAGTTDNTENKEYAFDLHRILPASPKRYAPLYSYKPLKALAKKYDVTQIYCDHPYMAPTAMALSRALKIPWYMRSHNIESERFRAFKKWWWPVMRSFERFAMRSADGVFFITPEDRNWGITNFQLTESKCHIIPYGTTLSKVPEGHEEAKLNMAKDLALDPAKPWLYFLGALDYYPNEQAVGFILNDIMPRLNNAGIDYQILIGGKGLKEELKQQIEQTERIKYIGFIPELDQLLKACDIMLNPVILGGGIKTKAIEALGYNKIVVSTESGAAGILPEACGNNLLISVDNDWDAFISDTVKATMRKAAIPKAFYDTYYWGKIAEKILSIFRHEK